MWSRRFLLVGHAGAVLAAALALALLGLLLLGLESIGIIDPSAPVITEFGLPGIVVYPLCWHVLIYRRMSYTRCDTDKVIALSYGACCLVVIVAFSAFYFYLAISRASEFPYGGAWLAFSFVWVPFVIALVVAIFAGILAVPFVAIARPIAFLHRAFLLAWFDSDRAAGTVD